MKNPMKFAIYFFHQLFNLIFANNSQMRRKKNNKLRSAQRFERERIFFNDSRSTFNAVAT